MAWTVRLAETAWLDFDNIIDWSAERFGARQAELYKDKISAGVTALREGPAAMGVKLRPDLGGMIFTLHLGRKARHFLVGRIDDQNRQIQVLRILHDSMDISRHLDP